MSSEDSTSTSGSAVVADNLTAIPHPISAQNASQPTAAAAAAASNDHEQPTDIEGASSSSDFPSTNLCGISREPPIRACTFDIPDSNGNISDQVFDFVTLFINISTPIDGSGYRHVRHPLTNATIHRSLAQVYIRDVSNERQEVITAERRRRGLSMDEPTEPSKLQQKRFRKTLRKCLEAR